MRVALLRGENLRAYPRFEIKPHERLNLLVGANAAGKTTLLEALFVLGRGRSFRAATPGELAGPAGRHWTAYGEYGHSQDTLRLGVGWDGATVDARIGGTASRLWQLARELPLQLIDPTGHRLIEDGPGYRRSYLDWGVFHVEPSFLESWQRYQRSLRQRNEALRRGESDSTINAWNADLVEMATRITAARLAHVAALKPVFAIKMATLLEEESQLTLEFQPGWPADKSFSELLVAQLPQHRRMGTTLQGPHRAELRLTTAGRRAKTVLSRGQQKLLVAALVLAQCSILIEHGLAPPLVLIDDFAAELSSSFQQRFVRTLADYPGQVFVTAFESPAAFGGADHALFHVEHHNRQSVVRPA